MTDLGILPVSHGDTQLRPTMRFRWVEAAYVKNRPNTVPVFDGFIKYTRECDLILQQMWLDDKGNGTWYNVEVEFNPE